MKNKQATTKVKVIQKEGEEEIAKEVLAKAIITISRASAELLKSGLRRDDLIALIMARTGSRVSKKEIRETLEGIEQLSRDYRK